MKSTKKIYLPRKLDISHILKKKSVLLLGPRRTGKTSLIRNQLEADRTYNLLQSEVFQRLSARPSLIRENLQSSDKIVVIDEIQKLPSLMDEVHSLIEDTDVRFVLTGSSARKLRRSHTSLMAGRAKTLHLHPFCHPEIAHRHDLVRTLHYGTLPPVFLSDDPWDELKSYTGDYLKEEIQAEAVSRRIENFSRFLMTAATSNGELLNYESIASDAQVPARTVREYYAVLEDTLVGSTLEPLTLKKASRKAVAKGKFYFFDLGVLNSLLGRKTLPSVGIELGNLFETWLYLEIRAYLDYSEKDEPLRFWRTHTGHEVDFVLAAAIGIEVKFTRMVSERDIGGLRELDKELTLRRKIVVSRDPHPRTIQGVEVMPYFHFLEALWAGDIL